MMASLKDQKEAFVTGLDGTTPQELLLICSSVPIGLWLFQFLPTTATKWQAVLSEALAFWVPMILCQTVYLYPWGICYLAVEVVIAAVCEFNRKGKLSSVSSAPANKGSEGNPDSNTARLGYLTVYRSALMYLTFVAILAVDFHVFPRRFVKTEETGYSLMDAGAASFIIAGGLVSPRARGKQHTGRLPWRKYATKLLPLVLMGSLRLVTHKDLEYQEHQSEYGVHWNFFFTLAALVPVAALLPGPSWLIPLLITGVHQYALSVDGLQEWVVNAPRSCLSAPDNLLCNLIAANREGLIGCVGYGALYLISEWIGCRYLWNAPTSRYGLIVLCSWCIVLWQVLVSVGIPVSRRTTNAAFLAWTLVLNMMQLAAIQLAATRGDKVPTVLMAVNRHGLIMFVLANLLTGAVNLSVNTLQVSNAMALVILFLYVSVVGIIAVLIDFVVAAFNARQKGGKLD